LIFLFSSHPLLWSPSPLPALEEDPAIFLVNVPTYYRKKNPNWYLRFRHRDKRSAKDY
jgi:hypothetical protein